MNFETRVWLWLALILVKISFDKKKKKKKLKPMNLGSIILTICSSHYYLIWDFTFTYIPKNISLGGGGEREIQAQVLPHAFCKWYFSMNMIYPSKLRNLKRKQA